MKLTSSKIRTFLLSGILVVALSLIFQESVQAECGGYVTIGNKAKLQELRAKGYLPAEMKSGHKAPQTNKAASISTTESNSRSESEQRMATLPSPTKPCSGPSCKSGKKPSPVPTEFIPTVCGAKSAFGKSSNGISKDPKSGFIGFQSFDETPIATINGLDRPPE